MHSGLRIQGLAALAKMALAKMALHKLHHVVGACPDKSAMCHKAYELRHIPMLHVTNMLSVDVDFPSKVCCACSRAGGWKCPDRQERSQAASWATSIPSTAIHIDGFLAQSRTLSLYAADHSGPHGLDRNREGEDLGSCMRQQEQLCILQPHVRTIQSPHH